MIITVRETNNSKTLKLNFVNAIKGRKSFIKVFYDTYSKIEENVNVKKKKKVGKVLYWKFIAFQAHGLSLFHFYYSFCSYPFFRFVAEITSYFCLARKLISPLWSSHIFTQ